MATRPKTEKKPRANPERPLAGQVALVAGATRGAGRGIARALGEGGAHVYCTGRSVRGRPSPYNRPETIEETAEMIVAAGGSATALRVDHTVEDEVRALVARIAQDHGRLDVLVNAIAGEDPLLGGWTGVLETDLSRAGLALEQSLLSHLVTAKHAAALMAKGKRGLIVEVTEGDLFFGGGNVIGDLVKSGLKALAIRLSYDLAKSRITAVSLTPGFLRSETMLERFSVTEARWREGGKKDVNFLHSETPLFVGRAVAALAADRKVARYAAWVLSSWELAREYGFTDADGSRPDWGKHIRDQVIPSMSWLRSAYEKNLALMEMAATRTRDYLSPVTSQDAAG
jgi:NAD(P)-dependent dehydrogenase (short-subunit alcohol dehydrogenase family)